MVLSNSSLAKNNANLSNAACTMDPRNSSDFLDQTIDFEPLNKGWDTLADCLQALSDAWESHEADQRSPELKETVSITNRPRSAPNLSDFLPDTDEALRAVALIELIKLDMELSLIHI